MGGEMSFDEDNQLEKDCYKRIIKPWLDAKGWKHVFIYYSKNPSSAYHILQKKNDIDIIADDGNKNVLISMKTVKSIYKKIFFETIKNTTTRELGWGYYTKADLMFYVMLDKGKFDNYEIFIFDPKEIKELDVNSYPVAYGQTYRSNSDELLYETEGRLIPIDKIKLGIQK